MMKQENEFELLQRDLRQIQSRDEIINQIHSYCFFFDSSDVSGLKGLFTDDAIVDYGPEIGPLSGIDEIIKSISRGLQNTFAATSHHISNIVVEFTGATEAQTKSYVYAWHRYQKKPEIGYLWGQYYHAFRFEEGKWKISRLKLRAVATQNFHRTAMHPVERFSWE